MPPRPLTHLRRHVSIAVTGLLAAGLAAGLALPAAAQTGAAQSAAMRTVHYLGYSFEVPASWPVLRLSGHRSTCVRFDLHAVYLGTPGTNQDCPSWLLGATEAMLIQPGAASAARTSAEDPVADEITAKAPGITVTATFDTDPTSIYRILASAGLAAPLIVQPYPARPAAASPDSGSGSGAQELAGPARRQSAARAGVSSPLLPATVSNDVGIGFDVCAAPSAGYMRAWKRDSSYSAVGIYIGGSDRACDQQNLTPSWVRREASAGWHFFLMYAGPQASFGQLKSPASQGTAAAKDAVVQAEKLGFGPRTPLYYDMEAYPAASTGPALRFLSAWTIELHKLSFESGVYSSSDSAVVDLARQYKKGEFTMPDVIYDALWNGSRNNSDSVYEAGEWTGGRRIHQFSGDVLETFGGDTLDVDQDYLDISLPAPGGTLQDSPGAKSASHPGTLTYEGTDHHLWAESAASGGHWSRTDLGGDLTSAPSVVQVGATDLDVFYRGSGGWLWERTWDGRQWTAARELPAMGDLGSGPRAVAQPNGVIDVFWRGSHDPHVWHAQYNPGHGWAGPQDLGGSAGSSPYPVETSSGAVQVFFEGSDGHLWRVARGLGQSWSGPEDLGMKKLGGPPHAVALPGGEVDVFWRGSTSPHQIWSAELAPGRAVIGPRRAGGTISGQPWPVASGGSEGVLFRGTDARLWLIRRSDGGTWSAPVRLTGTGEVATSPMVTAGPHSVPLEVFWMGAKSRLWAAQLTLPAGWGKSADLGGSVQQDAANS
jgi:hypothetical protein